MDFIQLAVFIGIVNALVFGILFLFKDMSDKVLGLILLSFALCLGGYITVFDNVITCAAFSHLLGKTGFFLAAPFLFFLRGKKQIKGHLFFPTSSFCIYSHFSRW